MTQTGLFSLDLSQFDQAASQPAPQVEADHGFTVRLKQTKHGHDILLCSVEPAPPEVIAQAEKDGLPLFTPSEIRKLAGASKEAVEHALAAKRAFPGCTLLEHTEEAGQ